jgi:hypothetical protein
VGFSVVRFLALEGVEAVMPLVVIDMFQLLDPGKALADAIGGCVGLVVAGAQ